VPEDRRIQGLVMESSIARNVTADRLAAGRAGWFPARGRAGRRHLGRRLEVKTQRPRCAAARCRGGNQQKVVIGKWLATEPRVLIIDEPTRGIDVGTKAEVHRLLSGLLGRGMAILMISSELPEVLGMADRVVVIHEGRVTAQLAHAQMSEERIMAAALGQPAAEAA
jgi:rhamnose transport system ATP-binding protein